MDVHDLLLSDDSSRSVPPGFDYVFVRDVTIQAKVGPDAWERDKPQPLTISATLPWSVQQAGLDDRIEHTLDYRTVYKVIRSFDMGKSEAQATQHGTPMKLAEAILQELCHRDWVRLDIASPKALLHSDGTIMRFYGRGTSHPEGPGWPYSTISVKALHIPCVIGIGEHERLQKQPVIVDFAVSSNEAMDEGNVSIPARFRGLYEIFEQSKFLTLEAFVTSFARHLTIELGFWKVAVSASKPGVFGMADGPGVHVVRTKDFFQQEPYLSMS